MAHLHKIGIAFGWLLLLIGTQGALAAPFAYITEFGANNLKVIDTADHTTVANIPVGRRPYGVAVSASGTRVYVTNQQDNSVSAIDAATHLVIATIAVGASPQGIVVDRSGTRVYVANAGLELQGSVSVIDAGSHAVIATVPVGRFPHGVALSPDGMRLYVANMFSQSISVIDTATFAVATTMAVNGDPYALAIDASGSRLYATFPNSRPSVIAFDTATGAAVATVVLNAAGVGSIALDPSRQRAYVTDSGTDFPGRVVFVLDATSLTLAAVLTVGSGPIGISVHPSAPRVYVANSNTGTVSVIDAASHEVLQTLPVGLLPQSFGNFIGPASASPMAGNYQGMWWKSPPGSESGWGMSIAHQGDILFATWFTYDTDGSALWLTMSNGARTGERTYSGTLHRTAGPAFDANPWNPAAVSTTAVGSGTLEFTDNDNGTFAYVVNGVAQSKTITRQVFASPEAPCVADGTGSRPRSFQDLWWRSPPGSESGWGVSIAHQGDVLFAVLFTYTAAGKGQWLVMSNGVRTADRTFSGTLYRTTGPALAADPWNPSQVTMTAVGTATFSFDFGDAGSATLAYSLDGVAQTETITRQRFASPPTVCR